MKPFNLKQAKAGKPVCTRDGRNVRIICFDVKRAYYPIIALVEDSSGEESSLSYDKNGRYFNEEKNCEDTCVDLFMKPEKHEGWINIYREDNGDKFAKYIYETKEEAKRGKQNKHLYIATAKIEWEE